MNGPFPLPPSLVHDSTVGLRSRCCRPFFLKNTSHKVFGDLKTGPTPHARILLFVHPVFSYSILVAGSGG